MMHIGTTLKALTLTLLLLLCLTACGEKDADPSVSTEQSSKITTSSLVESLSDEAAVLSPLAAMIQSGEPITCQSTKRVQTAIYREYNVGQGACSDGTHAYFILRNSGDTGARIVKHRLDDGSFVAVSEVLSLGHGNDMTYDAKNNRLVVAHGQSEGQILTLVDPDTLTSLGEIEIPKGAGAITYDAAKNCYAISQGGKTLHILDENFKLLASYDRTDATGYTAQGMGSDETYIYFPMSGTGDNILVVYDWSGNFVTTIQVPMKQESESLFFVNGTCYIAYNFGGEALYETVFETVNGK